MNSWMKVLAVHMKGGLYCDLFPELSLDTFVLDTPGHCLHCVLRETVLTLTMGGFRGHLC